MPAYHYTVIDLSGREQKGVLEADSDKHARQLLRHKSLIPLKVQPAEQKKSGQQSDAFTRFRRRGLTSADLALVTRQFATLLAAGLPIEECLLAVSEQTEKSHVKSLLLSIRSKVVEGHALASAFGEHPEAFSALFCATVAAGEKTGHLDEVLLRLADYTEQQANMRQKLKTALIYPAMIVLVAIAIVGFLLEYVVPKMVAVYGHMNQALPLMTSILIAISSFVTACGLYIVLGAMAGIYFWRRALKKSAALRHKTHQTMLRLPLIGNAMKTADTARFARTLSILTAAGVPAMEAMGISAKLISTIPIKLSVEDAVNRVREGASIHLSLKQTGYFSPMSVHMMASGEASGELESMLGRVAQHQEGEITRLIDVALALFEPAIILLMGSVVLFIVLAVLLPIFQLNEFTG